MIVQGCFFEAKSNFREAIDMTCLEIGFNVAQIVLAVLAIIATIGIAVVIHRNERRRSEKWREEDMIRREESEKLEMNDRDLFLWNFLTPRYLDETFTVYEYEYSEYKDGEPRKLLRSHTIELKEGRNEIKNRYFDKNDWKKGGGGREKFIQESNQHNPPTYENKLVHRFCVALNRVGQAAFDGKLHMENTFTLAAKLILEDWDKAKHLVLKEREDNPRYYNRIFFEWIAGVSCMYQIADKNLTEENNDIKRCIKQYAFTEGEFSKYNAEKLLIIDNVNDIMDKIIANNPTLKSELASSYIEELSGRFRQRIGEKFK